MIYFSFLSFILLFDVTVLGYSKTVTIFADFDNDNLNFFKETLPWIVHNIGKHLDLRYYFLDNGFTSVPRTCVIQQLWNNPYLQSHYLKCEADKSITDDCKHCVRIDDYKYHQCVRLNARSIQLLSKRIYRSLNSPPTPAIVISHRKIVATDNERLEILKEICTVFGRHQPKGCIDPEPHPAESIATKEITTIISTDDYLPTAGKTDATTVNFIDTFEDFY